MYRIVYDKQSLKDISHLKSVRFDKKAKELIEILRENPFNNPPPFERLVGNLKDFFLEESIYSIG